MDMAASLLFQRPGRQARRADRCRDNISAGAPQAIDA